MDFNLISQHLAQYQGERRIPPLEQWQPPFCGDMDMLIKANGEWWHEGRRMTRQKLIDLFATVLWREGDAYFLKTPVEKIGIQVEDAPLFIAEVNLLTLADGHYIECLTTNQDRIVLDSEHVLQMRPYQGELKPYVTIRANLDARIARHAFYHIVSWSELQEHGQQTVLRIPMGNSVQTLSLDNSAF
ncbi:DUF1285 domain-containing protein [Vitreoscilla massiliensis]|uniref:DUF1285 domain-containing protein n=1 Tax=Vitreoscilla massiliensis TaxID=1689272 RepID=A0ABY4E602_9NEIS|nr:DUF1285 domain-containing protein [Vitreoscilla massiliensis]UOO90709.1 DUF1285 domain-containing protein [Vitreoscilla massiliensis]